MQGTRASELPPRFRIVNLGLTPIESAYYIWVGSHWAGPGLEATADAESSRSRGRRWPGILAISTVGSLTYTNQKGIGDLSCKCTAPMIHRGTENPACLRACLILLMVTERDWRFLLFSETYIKPQGDRAFQPFLDHPACFFLPLLQSQFVSPEYKSIKYPVVA